MQSTALLTLISRQWAADAVGSLASTGCARCLDSDLLLEAAEPAHDAVHGLVVSIEEILDRAVEDYLAGAEPESAHLDPESRLESVDLFRHRLRAQARRLVGEALAARAA